jgi:C4-dicarboxylate-specific signal transduction histidine kinase
LSGSPRKEGGAVLVLRDISEWLQDQFALEQAREEMDSQRQHLAHIERLSTGGEMAAGIAHEVNQPLTAVTNYARVAQRLLADLPEDRRQKMDEVLSKISVQAERAAAVIQRMRSYVKKPSGGREVLDINQVLDDVIALAEVDSRVNAIPIELRVAENLPKIFADEVQLQQVALNLIRNAMESTANTGQSNAVEVSTYLDAGMVYFRVKDFGAGLAPEIEEQLFSPFVTSKEGGMGIGLSVSKSIMQAHGGDIRYQPNPNGGAIFSCEFPVHQ